MGRLPVEAIGGHEIVEWRRCKVASNRAACEISRSNQDHTILVSILERTKEPRFIPLYWTTDRKRILLSIERRRLVETAIKCRWKTLYRAVTKKERTRSM